MTDIANTGERILLEKETPLMIARHFSAYRFACGYLSGRKTLEVGCGEGYGSRYLADFVSDLTAVDYDAAVIEYARCRYQKENLHFLVANAKELEKIKDTFSAACSFQFIEHLSDAESFLHDVCNLLDGTGVFICSTPNRKDASPGSQSPFNRFHQREYLFEEFRGLLERHFKEVAMFGLKRSRKLDFFRRLKKSGICNFLPDSVNPVRRFYRNIDCTDFAIVQNNLDTALDFIAVCRK